MSEKKKNDDIITIDTSDFADECSEDQPIFDKIKEEIKEKYLKGIKSIIIIIQF